MAKKQYSYVVTVTRTDFDTDEEEVFEMEFDEDENLDVRENVVEALKISYYGCSDED